MENEAQFYQSTFNEKVIKAHSFKWNEESPDWR